MNNVFRLKKSRFAMNCCASSSCFPVRYKSSMPAGLKLGFCGAGAPAGGGVWIFGVEAGVEAGCVIGFLSH